MVPSPLSPVFAGPLLLALTRAPDTVKTPLLIVLAKYFGSENVERLIVGLKWIVVIGLLRRASNFLSELGQNNWRLRSEKHKYDWPREIAVVTGAAGGFGRLISKGLARKGIKVIAVDVAEKLPADIRNNPKIKYYRVDITDAEAVKEFGERVRAEHGNPSILINNAGIAYTHAILDAKPESLQKIFNVNIISHYTLLQQFLPSMIQKKKGHIVSVSSMAAYVTPVALSPYSATKAGVLCLHEGLGTELRTIYQAPEVKLTIVHPTFADTPMVSDSIDQLRATRMPILKAETVADAIVNQVLSGRGRQIVLAGGTGSWLSTIKGWPGWASQSLLQLPEKAFDPSKMPSGIGQKETAHGANKTLSS